MTDYEWMKPLCHRDRDDIGKPFKVRVGETWYVGATNGFVITVIAVEAEPNLSEFPLPRSWLTNYLAVTVEQKDIPFSRLREFVGQPQPLRPETYDCPNCGDGLVFDDKIDALIPAPPPREARLGWFCGVIFDLDLLGVPLVNLYAGTVRIGVVHENRKERLGWLAIDAPKWRVMMMCRRPNEGDGKYPDFDMSEAG